MSDNFVPEGSLAEPALDPLIDDIVEVDTEDAQSKEAMDIEQVRDELGVSHMIDPLKALLDAPIGPVTSKWGCPRLHTEFEIKALTSREYNQIQERATRFTRNKRTGRMDRDLDATLMSLLVCLDGTVSPNFRDPQLAERYPNAKSHEIISVALLPGEVDSLASKILSLSGFDEELEETGKD